MTHKYAAGFLVSAYLVFGIALVPMQSFAPSTPPGFQNVFWNECHWGCKSGHTPCQRTYLCTTEYPRPRKAFEASKPSTGSTGPTRPTPPKTGGAKHQ
jgi:hypothetical protein